MKHVLILFVCLGFLFFMACPLQTATPIDGPAVPVPSWMTGKWAGIKSNGSMGTVYLVKRESAPGKLNITSADSAATVMSAVLTKIQGVLFLSIYQKADDVSEEGYYHYAVEHTSSGDMDLVPLKEHGVGSDENGAAVAAYITKNAKTGDYLERKDTEHYKKQK